MKIAVCFFVCAAMLSGCSFNYNARIEFLELENEALRVQSEVQKEIIDKLCEPIKKIIKETGNRGTSDEE